MKRFLLILSFIVFANLHSEAQNRPIASANVAGPFVRFYPNPATTVVNFDFQKGYERGYTIQVYNFLGRKMYESTNLAQKTTIQLSDFTRGVYIYQLFDKTGKMVESGKFQVSK